MCFCGEIGKKYQYFKTEKHLILSIEKYECIACSFIVILLTYQPYSSRTAIGIVWAGNIVMFMPNKTLCTCIYLSIACTSFRIMG